MIDIEPKIKTITLEINGLKPVSINNAYYKYNKTLNTKAREYREYFLSQLSLHSKELKEFTSSFNRQEHALACSILFLMPKEQFIAKSSNEVSHRSGDVDNGNKLMLDFLFSEKYMNRPFRDFITTNIGIDDKFICQLNNTKGTGPNVDDFKLVITITIENRSQFENLIY